MKTVKKINKRSVRLSARQKLDFIQNLYLLVSSAIPPGQIFESLQKSSDSKKLSLVLEDVKNDVTNGTPYWKAFESTGLVSKLPLALIRIGEETGQLNDNLKIAARMEDKSHSLQAHLRSAMTYPIFVLSLTLVVGIGISWFLLPKLKVTFDSLDLALPWITVAILSFGAFLKAYGFIVVPLFLVAFMFMLYVLFIKPNTKHIGYKLLMFIPGIGTLIREVEIAKFGYFMAALLNSGITITRACELIALTTETPAYRKFYASLYDSFDQGYSFDRALQVTRGLYGNVLPWNVQQIIVTGEKSGSLAKSMDNIGQVFEERAEITTKNVESIIEPVLLVIVWLGVLMVAISVLLPIYSLVGGLDR